MIHQVTSRERPKSAPYLRLKNIQGTTIENIWKTIFFQKKNLVKKSHIAENPKKRPFRLNKRFSQTENFKKFKGVRFDKIQNFSEKCRIVPKKKPQRGDPLVSTILLKHKKFVI